MTLGGTSDMDIERQESFGLPWAHIKADDFHGHFIEDVANATVCDLYTMQGSCHEFENAEDRAAYIVKSANAHDRLVAALRRLTNALDGINKGGVECGPDEYDAAEANARAILNEIDGET